MAKPRFYAVIKGRNTGIFDRWEDGARPNVDCFPGALYKSFANPALAEHWWSEQAPGKKPSYYFERTGPADEPAPTDGRFFTYLIVDPRNGLPFYVGQTVCMESRKRGHLRIRVGKQRPSKKQIAEILAAGLEPEFRVVDEQTTQADSLRSETDWVKRLARQGIRVTNQWREHREWIEALASRQSPL